MNTISLLSIIFSTQNALVQDFNTSPHQLPDLYPHLSNLQPASYSQHTHSLDSDSDQIRKESDDAVLDFCKYHPKSPTICKGNLGIPRIDMPQLEDAEVLASYKANKVFQGIYVTGGYIEPSELTPVQHEINLNKVNSIVEAYTQGTFDPCAKPIIVSTNNKNGRNYIIDGHHRYAACSIIDSPMKMIAISDTIHGILIDLNTFPGITHQELGTFNH